MEKNYKALRKKHGLGREKSIEEGISIFNGLKTPLKTPAKTPRPNSTILRNFLKAPLKGL